MYEVSVLCANGTVSLQLVMNVLQWIVLSHCIYRVSNCCSSVTLLGYDRVLENVLGVLETSWNFLVSKRMGTLFFSSSVYN